MTVDFTTDAVLSCVEEVLNRYRYDNCDTPLSKVLWQQWIGRPSPDETSKVIKEAMDMLEKEVDFDVQTIVERKLHKRYMRQIQQKDEPGAPTSLKGE